MAASLCSAPPSMGLSMLAFDYRSSDRASSLRKRKADALEMVECRHHTMDNSNGAKLAEKRPPIVGIPPEQGLRGRTAVKRPRLSCITSPLPPSTPVLAPKSLPPPSPSPPSPPRPLRHSRYQHFTSPLCPRPSSSIHHHKQPSKRPSMARPSSPPHQTTRYGSLLQWTLQRNHAFAVRQRQYLAASAGGYGDALEIQPYTYTPSNESDSDSSDEEDDWDEDDGWDEGERGYPDQQYTLGASTSTSSWSIVPSQHPYSPEDARGTNMSIPRACTPPNSRQPSPDVEPEGEPIEIREGVTTILLT